MGWDDYLPFQNTCFLLSANHAILQAQTRMIKYTCVEFFVGR